MSKNGEGDKEFRSRAIQHLGVWAENTNPPWIDELGTPYPDGLGLDTSYSPPKSTETEKE